MATAVRELNLSPANLDRLKTAMAKATLNALEHSNRYSTKLPLFIRVFILEQVSIGGRIDPGSGPIPDRQTPQQTVEGSGQRLGKAWGFFLLHKMNDGAHGHVEEAHYTLELFLYREGDLR
jgi:hypothetical protein